MPDNPDFGQLVFHRHTGVDSPQVDFRDLDNIITTSFVWNPGNLADGAGETSSAVSVPGATFGDFVLFSAPYDLQGFVATAYVSAVGNVKIRIQNESGGAIDLASGTWFIRIIKL
jgi:hypothetical protein